MEPALWNCLEWKQVRYSSQRKAEVLDLGIENRYWFGKSRFPCQ